MGAVTDSSAPPAASIMRRMLRTLAAAVLAVALTGCNVCTRWYNAEAAANQKGQPCNSSSNLPDPNTCSNGLSSCSQDDVVKLNEYAQCLESLAACQSSTSFNWALQRASCGQALLGVSRNCLNAIQ